MRINALGLLNLAVDGPADRLGHLLEGGGEEEEEGCLQPQALEAAAEAEEAAW